MRGFEAMNSGDCIGHRFSRNFGIVVGLQVDPALCIGAEEGGQTQRSINGYAALTLEDLVDAAG
jgi:hypothetical protein